MHPRAAGDEETREGEMGLDLLGLGLLPPTMAAGGHGGGSTAPQQRPYEKTAAFDEPLSYFGGATAAETTASSAMRACVRRRLPVDVDDGGGGGGGVPAPPASMLLNPASSSTARWRAHAATSPPKLGSFRGVVFQVPSTSTSSDLAADGQGRAHAVATPTPTPTRASPLMQVQRAPCPAAAGGLFVRRSRPPVAAAGRLVFEGSASTAARSSHDDSTAPMTIIYAGSVRAYGGVTIEHAQKILAMIAKEAHAAGILPVQHAGEPQLELVAAPTATGGAMHWGLAHHVNDSLKRTASLARFLDKRKQRAGSSAAASSMRHPRSRREEWFPAQIMGAAPAATVSARTSASLGGMDRRPRATQDHPKRTKRASHAEEAVSTELKI